MPKKIKKQKVCGFVQKLIQLLKDETNENIIGWGDKPNEFLIKDVGKFTYSLAPQVFKHHNYASFVRQLNIYGFTKSKNGSETYEHEFLCKDNWRKLHLIQRKKSHKDTSEVQIQRSNKIQREEEFHNKVRFSELKNHFEQLKKENRKLTEDQKTLKFELTSIKKECFQIMKETVLQTLRDVKVEEQQSEKTERENNHKMESENNSSFESILESSEEKFPNKIDDLACLVSRILEDKFNRFQTKKIQVINQNEDVVSNDDEEIYESSCEQFSSSSDSVGRFIR